MNDEGSRSWDSLYGEWLRAWTALAPGGLSGDVAAQQFLGRLGGLGSAGQLMVVLAQANFASATALTRCCASAMESWAKYGQASAGSLAPLTLTNGTDREALARLVDETRAHLRRLRESAVEEAGVLDARMQALAEQLRIIVEDEPSSDEPHRYARTKL